jgi:hypothetical protein
MYGLPLLEGRDIADPVMIVNISRSLAGDDHAAIYDAAKGSWHANQARLEKTPGHYVIAEYYGVFLDIFKPAGWETVLDDNGAPIVPKRMWFKNTDGFQKGDPQYDKLFKKYCNKRNGFQRTGDRQAFHYFNM